MATYDKAITPINGLKIDFLLEILKGNCNQKEHTNICEHEIAEFFISLSKWDVLVNHATDPWCCTVPLAMGSE